MKEFTGAPKINKCSKKLKNSNISNILQTSKTYHSLMRSQRPNSACIPKTNPAQLPPKPVRISESPLRMSHPQPPSPITSLNPIIPGKNTTPRSVISSPRNNSNFLQNSSSVGRGTPITDIQESGNSHNSENRDKEKQGIEGLPPVSRPTMRVQK